jgi:hypothetical protein
MKWYNPDNLPEYSPFLKENIQLKTEKHINVIIFSCSLFLCFRKRKVKKQAGYPEPAQVRNHLIVGNFQGSFGIHS